MKKLKDIFELNENQRKIIYNHILIFSVISILIIIKFPCPFKAIFKIPCPACGSLHAFNCLIHLKFRESLNYNPFAVPLALAIWAGIHKDSILKKSKWVDIFIVTVSILAAIYYIFKITCII